eukprot:9476941-Alexandrium_andersonii.AAC.1
MLEGVDAIVDPRCPRIDGDGHLREICADPVPDGEVVDPPMMPMPRDVEFVDVADFGRSRLEVMRSLASRMLGATT